MESHEELFALVKRLKAVGDLLEQPHISEPLNALEEAALNIGKSFSGSWFGYHSRVYYKDLQPPPPGANFSQEWGLKDMSFTSLGSHGDWLMYDPDAIKRCIFEMAGDPDLTEIQKEARNANEIFDHIKSDIIFILSNELEERTDSFLETLFNDLKNMEAMEAGDFANRLCPKGQIMTRDTLALGQGTKVPPHIGVRTRVLALRHPFNLCSAGADVAARAASHLERKTRRKRVENRIGTNVFIGHGRSPLWRELKDFVQDRLTLPWDEFNRVPVAGVTNITRLSEMLDAAAIALLVLTAEDEKADGSYQARLNVVHEAGLFQGRLGFTRAIVLLEEGCEEFSNIQGLGQIRFPKGNIEASFEEVRRVMEREGIIRLDN